jgi:hypothetical protein
MAYKMNSFSRQHGDATIALAKTHHANKNQRLADRQVASTRDRDGNSLTND